MSEEDNLFPSRVTFSFNTNISHRGLKVRFQVEDNFGLQESCVAVCETEPTSDIRAAEKIEAFLSSAAAIVSASSYFNWVSLKTKNPLPFTKCATKPPTEPR